VVVTETLTVIFVPVNVFNQVTVPLQPSAVKVTWLGSQIAVFDAVIVGAAPPPDCITIVFELVLTTQTPLQIAEYLPKLTEIDCPVEPLLHFTEAPSQPVAVNVAVSFPHIFTLFALIVGAFCVFPVPILIVFVAALSHVCTIHLTVYVVALVNLTINLLLVAPVFHNKSPVQLLSFKCY